jgi:RNA polymerase subunit RPABC4/transcription elongation factor Spt4
MKQLRIPPLLIDFVQSGLLACEGVVFNNRDACPVCGGELSGYDTKKKQFAVMLEVDKRHPIHVLVKRFSCRQCHAVCFADEPFYPDTRIGSPLVDLCKILAAGMSFYRATAFMAHMGIVIERGTVRNYAYRTFPEIPTTDLFGIRLPLSIFSLSELAARAGEGGRIEGTEALAACGFPSAYRAAPDRLLPLEQGKEWKKEEDKEERQADRP